MVLRARRPEVGPGHGSDTDVDGVYSHFTIRVAMEEDGVLVDFDVKDPGHLRLVRGAVDELDEYSLKSVVAKDDYPNKVIASVTAVKSTAMDRMKEAVGNEEEQG